MQRMQPPTANSSRPINQSQRPSITSRSSITGLKVDTNGRKSSIQTPASATLSSTRSTPTTSAEPSKPPKKGSYAEIMARGKAAQATLGQVGKIQHKRIEKVPSKREREEMKSGKVKRLQKVLGPGGKFDKAGQDLMDSKNGRRDSNGKGSRAPVLPEKKVKKAALATTGYAGTARPKPGVKGSSRPSISTSSRYGRNGGRYQDERNSSRYTYVSEEEDDMEEEEDDEDRYASDASSDMEAAVYEVDDEEEEAARIARKEDAEALREETRLKREKEEKRRRLAAMAKSRR